MEYSNLENDNNYKEELILAFVNDVSPLVFSNIITDDNISPKNGLSGLDQVIMFEVGKDMDDIFDLDFVRAGIRIQVGLMKKDLKDGLISEEDIADADFYKDIYEDEEEYLDDIDDYDDEYWAEYYEYDDERFQRKIRRITVGHMAGKITTDNPSKINGLTGYEQAVYYVAHLLPVKDEEERKRNIELIDRKVQAYLIDFDGGMDLPSLIDNY
jgi:hypothetical protein